MITRRDLLVVLIAIAGTAGVFALAGQAPVMGSAVFYWNSIPATPTEVGSVRSFFKARTATLDELEMHVTTLLPGKTSHPPHRHPNEELIIVMQGTVETLSKWQLAGMHSQPKGSHCARRDWTPRVLNLPGAPYCDEDGAQIALGSGEKAFPQL